MSENQRHPAGSAQGSAALKMSRACRALEPDTLIWLVNLNYFNHIRSCAAAEFKIARSQRILSSLREANSVMQCVDPRSRALVVANRIPLVQNLSTKPNAVRPAARINQKSGRGAAVPPDRRTAVNILLIWRWARRWVSCRHGRDRRRVSDDAAPDLHRIAPAGSGRLRPQTHRGIVVFRRAVLRPAVPSIRRWPW